MSGHYAQGRRPGFRDGAVRGLSISMVVFGSCVFGLGVSSLATALTTNCYLGHSTHPKYCYLPFTYSSPGIWSGLMFITGGIIGLVAAKRKTNCFIVASMALSLIMVWVTALSITLVVMANVNDNWMMSVDNKYPMALYIQNGLVGFLSLVCSILSLIIFGFACSAVCCRGSAELPRMKQSGPLYQPLPVPVFMNAPTQTTPMQGVPAVQQNAVSAQPIYLVQGHRVVGMLPPNTYQATAHVPPMAFRTEPQGPLPDIADKDTPASTA